MLKKIFSTMGTRLIVAIANFVTILLLSQFLFASGKGEASLILASVAIILVFSNIVGGATLVYLVPRQNFTQLISASYLWSLMVSITAYFIMDFAAHFMNINSLYVEHIAILSFLNSILSINLTCLIGKEKIGENNIISILQQLSGVAFIGATIITTQSLEIEHYIQSLYLAYTLASILSLWRIIPYFERWSGSFLKTIKECFRVGIVNQAAHLLTIINFRISYYVLNNSIDSAAVGIYSNAISLIESTWIITRSVAMVQYSKIANTDDAFDNQQLTNKLSKLSIVLSIALLIPMSLLPASFYEWIFGKEFGEINTLILIMAPSIILYNYYLIMGHYFSGIGNYMVSVYAAGAGVILTICTIYPFIQKFGIHGASYSANLAMLSASLVVLIWFKKEAKIGFSDLWIRKEDLKF